MTSFFSASGPDPVDELEVGLQGVPVQAREVRRVPRVVRLQRTLGDRAGEDAAAERRVGNQADAQLADGRQDLVLEVAGEQRVHARLHLHLGLAVDGGHGDPGAERRLGERQRYLGVQVVAVALEAGVRLHAEHDHHRLAVEAGLHRLPIGDAGRDLDGGGLALAHLAAALALLALVADDAAGAAALRAGGGDAHRAHGLEHLAAPAAHLAAGGRRTLARAGAAAVAAAHRAGDCTSLRTPFTDSRNDSSTSTRVARCRLRPPPPPNAPPKRSAKWLKMSSMPEKPSKPACRGPAWP